MYWGRRASALAVWLTAALASGPAGAAPHLPGEPCGTELPEHQTWLPSEEWAWGQICEGRIADFDDQLSERFDPRESTGWGNRRKLRQIFLETILLHEPFRGAIPRQGVRIVGAWFPEQIDLTNAKIEHEMWLKDSRFEGSLILGRVRMSNLLILNGSTFEGDVYMDKLQIESSLFMDSGAVFKKYVILQSAKVGGLLSMTGSTFEGAVIMDSLEVKGGLRMSGGARFRKDVILADAKVGSNLAMSGSTFEGAVNMDKLQTESSLFMRDGTSFKKKVILAGAKVGGQLSMTGSTFAGAVDMEVLKVGGGLFMGSSKEFGTSAFKGDVNLRDAKVGGQLEMTGSTFDGAVNMDKLQVESSLFMRNGANFKGDVNLGSAKVGSNLEMSGSTFAGGANMDSLQVEGNLFMAGGTSFKKDVILADAKVGSNLALSGSTFEGEVKMHSLQVESSLLMNGATFAEEVSLIFAEIGKDLNLSGAELAVLDLTGTRVGSDLRLGSAQQPATEWKERARLVLRNAHAGALEDRWDQEAWDTDKTIIAWPQDLQLDGFTYDRLGGFRGGGAGGEMLARPVSWYVDWLKRDPSYSPQPYRQLAEVFRAAGYGDKANDILYEGRERVREEAWKAGRYSKWLGLTLLNVTIGYGYGYRYFYALRWVALFLFLGVAFLRLSGEGRRNGMPFGLSFSLDHLLPVVQLRKYHYDKVQLQNWVRYYFYVHKLVGYVLASFLIAGLSGLTQL